MVSLLLQLVFSNFFHGQMLFHAKALELYTTAFQRLSSLDEEQDIEVLLIQYFSMHVSVREKNEWAIFQLCS